MDSRADALEESMVGRVAKALAPFFSGADKAYGEHTEAARAAIEAMREPTPNVLRAGITAIENAHETTQDSYEEYVVTSGADYALPGWQAMIDEALSSSPEGGST